MDFYLGVDPGKKGGLALIDDQLQVVALELMPTCGGDLYRWLTNRASKTIPGKLTVVLEKVHSMSGQGAQSTFTFGMELGKCEALIDTLACIRCSHDYGETEVVTITPQAWMKAIPQIQRKVNDFKTKTLWKRYLGSIAKELFPKASIWNSSWWNKGRTDAVSDAMLLAHYGWLTNQ